MVATRKLSGLSTVIPCDHNWAGKAVKNERSPSCPSCTCVTCPSGSEASWSMIGSRCTSTIERSSGLIKAEWLRKNNALQFDCRQSTALTAVASIMTVAILRGLKRRVIARLGIIRTFQKFRIYHDMSSLDNVRISLPGRFMRWNQLLLPLPESSAVQAGDLLDLVGLRKQAHQMAGELSFGQQRLLELAMVLMNEPQILLLDEPTAGVNPAAISLLIECLRRVRSELGITLLVIEHNMTAIMRLADRDLLCLNRGQVLAHGEPAEIRQDRRVIDAYLGAQCDGAVCRIGAQFGSKRW